MAQRRTIAIPQGAGIAVPRAARSSCNPRRSHAKCGRPRFRLARRESPRVRPVGRPSAFFFRSAWTLTMSRKMIEKMTAAMNEDAAMDWDGWGGWGPWY